LPITITGVLNSWLLNKPASYSQLRIIIITPYIMENGNNSRRKYFIRGKDRKTLLTHRLALTHPVVAALDHPLFAVGGKRVTRF